MKIDIIKDFERFLLTQELSDNTIKNYLTVAKYLEKHLMENYGISFDNDGYKNIKGYMVSSWATSIIGLKVATRANYITIMNVFLKYLYNLQYVDFDLSGALPPVPNIEKYNTLHPEEVKAKRNYTKDELAAMMNDLNPNTFIGARNRALIACFVLTGLRSSELASMRICEMKPGITKVARKGTHGCKVDVAVPEEVVPYVEAYLVQRRRIGLTTEPEDWLFVTNRNAKMDYRRIYDGISYVQRKLGIPTGVHTFRHTALTEIQKTSDPATARDVAGQKSIQITNRYLHATDVDKMLAVKNLASLLDNN